MRYTLKQVQEQGALLGPERRFSIDGCEVAVTYFRAGYSPKDYPTEAVLII